MRDVIAVVLVGALIVGAYFGYKVIFGGEGVSTESQAAASTSSESSVSAPQAPISTAQPADEARQAAVTTPPQSQETKPAESVAAAAPQESTPTLPTQEDPARKLFEQARILLNENRTQEAATCLNTTITQYPDSPYSAPAAATLGGIMLGIDKWTARNLYSFAFDHTQDSKLREDCKKALDPLNAELVFSPKPGGSDSKLYQIQPGEVLTTIAAKFNCPYRFIMLINNIDDARNLRAGDRIKVLTGPKGKMEMKIVVDKSDFTLTVYLNNCYLKQYKVGLGKFDKTPVGTFAITERVEKPTWRGLKHGDPNNILGDYWLTLASDKFSGLGIHGTNEPDTIGKNASEGCIRMRNEDIKELYIMVPKGTEVSIRE
jgi:predicted negative regulator of RcsB-dependent stress response